MLKKIVSILIVLSLITAIPFKVRVSAKTEKTYAVSTTSGVNMTCTASMFTTDKVLAKKIETLFDEYGVDSFFNKTVFNSTQCMAFARYVWMNLFGCYGAANDVNSVGKYEALSYVPASSMTKEYFDANVKFGAQMRTYYDTHSMIYLGCDDYGIYVYHANVGPSSPAGYRVKISYYTWSEFRTQFSGMSYIYNPKASKVYFDANGGKVSTASKSVVLGGAYKKLPKAEKDGYKFKGWYTSKSGKNKITKDTTVGITYNQILYARWEKIILEDENFKIMDISITPGSMIWSQLKNREYQSYVENQYLDRYLSNSSSVLYKGGEKSNMLLSNTIYTRKNNCLKAEIIESNNSYFNDFSNLKSQQLLGISSK